MYVCSYKFASCSECKVRGRGARERLVLLRAQRDMYTYASTHPHMREWASYIYIYIYIYMYVCICVRFLSCPPQ